MSSAPGLPNAGDPGTAAADGIRFSGVDPAAEHRRPRRAYSYRTAALDYSQSESAIRRAVRAGLVRTRRIGGGVRLHPDDLEREFGFSGPPQAPEPAANVQLQASLIVSKMLGRRKR